MKVTDLFHLGCLMIKNVLNTNPSQQLDDLTTGYRADGENPDGWEDDAGVKSSSC